MHCKYDRETDVYLTHVLTSYCQRLEPGFGGDLWCLYVLYVFVNRITVASCDHCVHFGSGDTCLAKIYTF